VSVSRQANAIVDMVAVAEAFSAGRLSDLMPTIAENDLRTWKKRQAAWRKHFSLELSAWSGWSALQGFVDVRNALQHGLGRLTEMQVGSIYGQILTEIQACGVDLNGDLLTIVTSDVERCYQSCVEFILWLDATAPAQ